MSIQTLLEQFGEKYLLALLTTYKLTASAFILALFLGIVITIMRVSPVKPLQIFADFYVQIFRNIPGSALLIILVYALPYLNVILSYYVAVLTATTLIPAAFCSEYLMSGMNTIGPGQIEAARSLGMTFIQSIKNVVIPQAVRSSVLPMTNLLVATMLTSALASQVPLNPTDLTGIVSYINTHAEVGNQIDRKVRILR